MNYNFKIADLSQNYSIKQFTENDIPQIYSLAKMNTTYYKYMNLEPTYENIKEVITSLPKNKTLEDKFFLGFYHDNHLVAILDLILKYPNEDTAFIGWFMMNKEFQHKGVGTKIVTDIFSCLKENDFFYIRLGYIKENNESKNFWIKNGFTPTKLEIQNENYVIVVMERKL